MSKKIEDKISSEIQKSILGGGKDRIEKRHKQGKLTARERIELLLDKNSFEEIDMFVKHENVNFGMENHRIPGDGVA